MEMPIKLERPLAFFDIEATGFDRDHDKIVEICFIKLWPDGREEEYTERVNPGMPIPPEAIAIHGIKNEDVKGAPPFKSIAPRVIEILEGSDLAGFHLTRFDIPVLKRELAQAGFEFSLDGRLVIDAMKIFHKKEERNLAAAYSFYCGKTIVHAHSAYADTRATMEVLAKQLERYADLPKDMGGLHNYCNQRDARFVDADGKFLWRHNQACFNFGKYRSRSLKEIAKEDPEYLVWLAEESSMPEETKALCRKALGGEFPKNEPNA